ncbi:MAG: VOC family protein [Novosphingobium sp.]|jgi:hypothetical protein|nr:VOC family protein [Novosphingobium sp.]
MFMRNHYQNAYITHDIDKAKRLVTDRWGIRDYILFEPDMVLQSPAGPKQASVRVALGWCDHVQIELIQPVMGWTDPYACVLPADRTDAVPRFHHIAVRRDDEAAMRREIAELGLPVVFEGSVPGLVFIYLDARESLGHFFEYVWADAAGWAGQGWPVDMAVQP